MIERYVPYTTKAKNSLETVSFKLPEGMVICLII